MKKKTRKIVVNGVNYTWSAFNGYLKVWGEDKNDLLLEDAWSESWTPKQVELAINNKIKGINPNFVPPENINTEDVDYGTTVREFLER